MKNKFKILPFLVIGFLFTNLNGCKKDDNIPTVSDIDGNKYVIKTIGSQTWMIENLRVNKYNDGTEIPNISENSAWVNMTTGAYCTYNNTQDVELIKNNGKLYNWYAVNTKKLCPKGWHVPSDNEWSTLQKYCYEKGYGNSKSNVAKSLTTTSGWIISTDSGAVGNNQSTNNQSGFSATPSGYRSCNDGGFYGMGEWAGYWKTDEYISTQPNLKREIGTFKLINSYSIPENLADSARFGLSVRCLKD